jgi:hypothetical protein
MSRGAAPTVAVALAAALAACASDPAWNTPDGRAEIYAQWRYEPWVPVATCSGTDWMTIGHVTNVLLAAGIPSAAEGSVLYGISVPRSLVGRARGVLVEQQRPGVYACSTTDAQGVSAPALVRWDPGAAPATKTTYGVRVAEALARPSLDPRVAAALRDRHVADLDARLPVLESVELRERPYLADDGTLKRGADLHVRLANAHGSPEGHFDLHFICWDGEPRSPFGTSAMFQGSRGLGPALEGWR